MNKLELLLKKVRNRNTESRRPHLEAASNLGSATKGTTPRQNDTIVRPAQSCAEPAAPTEMEFTVKYITDSEEAAAIAETEFDSELSIGVDIETMKMSQYKSHSRAGLSPHLSRIRLLQACQTLDKVYVFDIPKTGLEPLMPILTGPMVAHNARFEMSHLYHSGIEISQIDCTMLMYNALRGGTINLKDLTKQLLDLDISKEEQASDWSLTELSSSQIQYAARDAWLVFRLYPILKSKLEEQQKMKVYELLREAQFPVMKMEYNGCHFDASTHWLLMDRIKEDLEAAKIRLKAAVGPNVSLTSNKQLSDHYKKVLDPKILKKWPRTEKGDDLCLDKRAVQKFTHVEVVEPLVRYKRFQTLVQNFGSKLLSDINPVTGRIHPEYGLGAAKTGRFTCSKPNLQQIPHEKEFRDLFSAPNGRKILVADYSQIELRVLAMLAKELTMLEAYRNGEDLHRLTAASMAGIPPDDVSGEQRRAAKPVNFGIIFGMGSQGLSNHARDKYNVVMTPREAKKNIQAFFEKYPAVEAWGNNNKKSAAVYRFVETKMGRKIRVDKPHTQSRNYPVQGSAGEVMLAAIIELDREIAASGLDIKMVNIIHDEIVLEVAATDAEQAKDLLERAMINGMLRVFPEAHTTGLVEAGVGDTWGEAK